MEDMLRKFRALIIGGNVEEAESMKRRQLLIVDGSEADKLQAKFAEAASEARVRINTPHHAMMYLRR